MTPLDIASFRPESGSHRPRTQCKLIHSHEGLYGIFKVEDRYIRCIHTTFQSDVHEDSSVEIFLQPPKKQGYFNFEFNCGGTLFASYVTNSTRVNKNIKEFQLFSQAENLQIKRFHSLPSRVDPEQKAPATWLLEFFIPFAILENYVGNLGDDEKQLWKGNAFKCGEKTSHPHWGSWVALDELEFHAPANFGELRFR
ncbi:MAG: carbohydrate-binding family 9-like protein [Candidatus Marinimicrobia bacterium]|nr:carbohydrate-binding family 9-like protein [Candidatus Neomarinimicrobiota bacterium]